MESPGNLRQPNETAASCSRHSKAPVRRQHTTACADGGLFWSMGADAGRGIADTRRTSMMRPFQVRLRSKRATGGASAPPQRMRREGRGARGHATTDPKLGRPRRERCFCPAETARFPTVIDLLFVQWAVACDQGKFRAAVLASARAYALWALAQFAAARLARGLVPISH